MVRRSGALDAAVRDVHVADRVHADIRSRHAAVDDVAGVDRVRARKRMRGAGQGQEHGDVADDVRTDVAAEAIDRSLPRPLEGADRLARRTPVERVEVDRAHPGLVGEDELAFDPATVELEGKSAPAATEVPLAKRSVPSE